MQEGGWRSEAVEGVAAEAEVREREVRGCRAVALEVEKGLRSAEASGAGRKGNGFSPGHPEH